MVSLVKIVYSPVKSKKYRAFFSNGRIVDFGASGYEDFISYSRQPGNIAEAKKRAYIARHGVNESWTDPFAASTLSRYVLWNLPTLAASVADYKKRFGV
jgi:hypothetical protein